MQTWIFRDPPSNEAFGTYDVFGIRYPDRTKYIHPAISPLISRLPRSPPLSLSLIRAKQRFSRFARGGFAARSSSLYRIADITFRRARQVRDVTCARVGKIHSFRATTPDATQILDVARESRSAPLESAGAVSRYPFARHVRRRSRGVVNAG